MGNAGTRTGRIAEQVVAEWLREHGWVVVGTNVRVGHLELDVVARRDGIIAVVEVRTRGAGAWTTALGSIDARKRERVRRAGERLWQRRFKRDATAERMRFDAASVTWHDGEPRVEYVAAAF